MAAAEEHIEQPESNNNQDKKAEAENSAQIDTESREKVLSK